MWVGMEAETEGVVKREVCSRSLKILMFGDSDLQWPSPPSVTVKAI